MLACALILGLVVAAATGGLGGGGSSSGEPAATTPTLSGGSGNSSSSTGGSGRGSMRSGGSQGGAADQPDPRTLRHPNVAAQMRTYPRLEPSAGGRNTTFALSFRIRKNLGPHGHAASYYGAIVSSLTGHPRNGCYGFGRYVRKGRRGQIAHVALHPRGRRWCPGTYEASVYLTARPYCPPSRHPHPCSTASYAARPTGWAYFTVR